MSESHWLLKIVSSLRHCFINRHKLVTLLLIPQLFVMASNLFLSEKVESVKGKDGLTVPVKDLDGPGKVLGLYFSAHWCPPCRGFTPKLADWYKKLTGGALKDKLEIVFVSSDRDEASFDLYYKDMPWLSLPFDERDAKVI